MQIKTAVFVKGINGTDPILQDGRPQVAFIGRSNVGKSSVINSLSGQKDLVRSSPRPGKTREINFFLVNNRVYFVDLPGYGYARMSPQEKEHLRKLILWYLVDTKVPNRTTVLIIDGNVGPTSMDLDMLLMLQEQDLDVVVVANKIDKVKKSQQKERIADLEGKLGIEPILPYSAETHEYRENLLTTLLS